MSVRTTRRALERLAGTPPSVHEHTDVLRALIDLGGALRLGLEIPSALRRWMMDLERADVEAAIAPLAKEAEARRDDADNVQRALVRIAMTNGWTLSDIAHAATLRQAVRRSENDDGRDRVKEGANGANGASDHHGGAGGSNLALSDGSVRAAVPDDDIVDSYVRRGAMARYVEGVARQNPAFAEELMACIDAAIDAEHTVCDAARAWRRRGVGAKDRVAQAVDVAPVASNERDGAEAAEAARSTNVVSIKAARRFRVVGLLSLAATLVLCVGGYSFYANQRESERIQAVNDKDLAEKHAQLDKLMQDLKAQQEAIAAAEAEAANAKSDADREMAQAKLSAAQEQQRRTQANIKAAGPTHVPKARAACTCQAGDPLCSCL